MPSDDNKVKKCFDISDKRNTGVMYVDFFLIGYVWELGYRNVVILCLVC
jgi:hypothetical protein